MNAVTHLEKVIVGEVSAVTHLEKVIAGETSAVTYTEKVIAGEATPITHLQKVIAGVESPVTHLEYIWAGGSPTPTEHEYTGAVPYTFTADGSPLISWRISGNTVQNGTPTPQNPVDVVGVGELETTGEHAGDYKIPISSANTSTPVYLGEVETTRKIYKRIFTGQEEWGISGGVFWTGDVSPDYLRVFNTITYICSHYQSYKQHATASNTPDMHIAMGYNTAVRRIYLHDSRYTDTDDFKTYLAQQYAAGTPVTIWYVLANEETGIVNEPLMRIGEYADTLSMEQAGVSIPTNNGSTTVDVATTLKPSEVYIKYKGV